MLKCIKNQVDDLGEFAKQTDIKDHEAFKYLDSVKPFWTSVQYFYAFTKI